ncbi:U-box domain-containing protein 33-like isoform X2 [Rhodamnia argentea]|uniref:RING-type E3 ubiquitin transferase n=1 Tax=Rhodamnia argentea TaxID=178133 RepID=A0ABM3HWL5_9MYRT|nr:U-box domain-containing protein 33-like isoform X2 [Rhodamnia argentea]
MEVSDGQSPARVFNERVYVAVGRDVTESKSALLWALYNFGGDFGIIHVHQHHQLNPSERPFYDSSSRNPEELARQEMESILDEYIHICDQARVQARKRYIEMQDIGKGIVELIEQHAITKLVMGAAADRHYLEGMQLTSMKAKFVNQHAHPSCHIWFVCNGLLICSREGDLNTYDMDVTPTLPGSFVVESGLQNIRSPPLSSLHSRSNSSEVEDDLALVRYETGEGSNHMTESSSVRAHEGYSQNQSYTGMEGSYSEDLYEQLDQARKEVERAKREALEELIRRQKAEKTANEASRKLKTLENVYNEQLRWRKDLEELLPKEKEAFEVLKKQHEELQMLNEELLASQTSEPSSARREEFISVFSFSDIEEATQSFDPSLMIEEGEYGSTYKGSLHHTQVAIKMLHLSNYHHEIQVATKSRHPNLVSLIGVCPDISAAIYEYLPNGSLEDQLRARDSSNHLSWQTRIHICADTCAALMFLHSCYGLVHGDLKPGNILLDSNFVAKITNFGLHSASSHSPTTGELSFASDVYSFGDVLLRLLTGRAALNLDEVMQNALDVGHLSALLDPTAGQWPFEQAKELAHLALSCRDIDSTNRPCLRSQVWPVLERMRTCCEASLSSRSGPEEPGQPPQYFTCPISHEIMQDPHVAADGFTYEAEAIRFWLSGHDTSPMTNLQLPNCELFPNQTLRSMIQEWLQNH